MNLVTDESTGISNNRIINTSVITNNSSSFYISNIEAEPRKLGAEEVVDHTITQAKKFTKGDLSKPALWTTDTCATMRAAWKKVERIQALQHIFIAPCDSHRLQLVIKDLLQRSTIEKAWKITLNLRNATK